MKNITILGSTGSIGVSTLQVLALHPGQFNVVALTGHKNVERLFEQCVCYRPAYAVLQDATAAEQLQARLHAVAPDIRVLSGPSALEYVASLAEVDDVVAAIVGAAGLMSTLAAVRAGKRVLLANKESLVMAGAVFMEEVQRSGATLLPIDSEHNALFQCMPTGDTADKGIRRIIITASGGPFRKIPRDKLHAVTPDEACAHPNWQMGRKISTDSATMMNKGLEVIEAHWLFGLLPGQIDVVIHPESIVHSLVEYIDGSMLAQLSNPDMRTPIAHVLAWPTRMASGVKLLDLLSVGHLTFEAIDKMKYPCLSLAYQALSVGGTATAILNAANEVAVQAFFQGSLKFTEIPELIEQVLSKVTAHEATDLSIVLADDAAAREVAEAIVA